MPKEDMIEVEGTVIEALPNAMFTFAEYLYDFAPEGLKQKGLALIASTTQENFPEGTPIRKMIEENLQKIKEGKRDLYF